MEAQDTSAPGAQGVCWRKSCQAQRRAVLKHKDKHGQGTAGVYPELLLMSHP